MSSPLEAALALAPSPEGWRAALDAIERHHTPEDYPALEPLLAAWPDEERRVPTGGMAERLQRPITSLCRTLKPESVMDHAVWEQLVASPYLGAIRRFELEWHIEDAGLKRLAAQPFFAHLRALRLRCCALTEASVPLLAGLDTLEELELDDNARIGSAGLKALAQAQLPRLRALSLAGCGVDDDAARALAQAPHLAALRTLNLGAHEELSAAALEALLASAALPALETLHARLKLDGQTRLPAPTLAALRVLNLRLTLQATTPQLEALAASPMLGAVTGLTFGITNKKNSSAATLEALAGSPHLGRLEQLELCCSTFEAASLRALLDNPSLNQLHHLTLESCKLTEGHLAAVAASHVAGQLRTLSLYNNALSPQSAAVLAAAPSLDAVQTLCLIKTKLGDEGLIALVSGGHLRGLRALELNKCGLGKPGGEALLRSGIFSGLERCDVGDNAKLSKNLRSMLTKN